MFSSLQFIERNAFLLLVLTLITIAIGGIVEVVPLFTIETTVEHVKGVRPYSPLEQRGRDIYTREGCYVCHSQQIRALRDEVERYGHFSLPRACTTIRSSGAPSASAPIWHASAASIPATGTTRI